MKKYTKQIAVLASLALFAPWVNAQEVTIGGDAIEGGGSSLTGDMIVEGDATVNGTLTVQPDQITVIGPIGTTPGAGEQTELGGVVPGTGGDVKVIQTLIDSNAQSQTTDTGGGFTAEPNGDVTLSATTSETTSVSYGRAVTQEVAQPGNVNPVGIGIAGTEEYYVVNLDTGAQVAGPFASEFDLDEFLAGETPASLLARDTRIGETIDNPSSGGNLQVGGDANVGGVLSLEDTGSGAVADAAAAINDNTAAIDDEETARIAADGVLQDNIDDEETARIAADGVLQANIDDEVTARIAADGVLQDNIDDEETARIAADGVLQANIDDEVTARSELIRREQDGIHIGEESFILDDTVPNHRLTTNSGDYLVLGGGANNTDVWVDGDLEVAGEANFQQNINVAGDVFVGGRTQGLQSQVDRNRSDIDRNARGIAMVAALQHTTVLPDMTHALDLSAAHFEGETGMALNYARRINDNVQINFGAASTSDFDESVIKAGVGFQW